MRAMRAKQSKENTQRGMFNVLIGNFARCMYELAVEVPIRR